MESVTIKPPKISACFNDSEFAELVLIIRFKQPLFFATDQWPGYRD